VRGAGEVEAEAEEKVQPEVLYFGPLLRQAQTADGFLQSERVIFKPLPPA
jgi:hypothetical protein